MQVCRLAATGAVRPCQRGPAVPAFAMLTLRMRGPGVRLDRASDGAAGDDVRRCFPMSFHGRKNNIFFSEVWRWWLAAARWVVSLAGRRARRHGSQLSLPTSVAA